jgi:hypothetical protein
MITMFRAIIIDNLMDTMIKTKPCKTEDEAKEEGKNSVKRLYKKFKKYDVSESDNRFYVDCIQID